MNIIKDGEIYISETDWLTLNRTKTESEIIKLISDSVSVVDLPYRKLELEEAQQDFRNLVDLNSNSLIKTGDIFTKYDYKYELTDLYIDLSNVGNKASDYFHQESRFKCDSINSPSPYRLWTTEKFRLNFLKNLWSMPTTRVDSARLRTALSLRGYVASQFRPSAAKAMYELYKAKNILDFSSGWGDRLAGFYASKYSISYKGYDPNTRLIEGYLGQIDLYEKDIMGKSANMYIKPAEEMYPDNSYDFIFTSPPYFDLERYSRGDTQSWRRYKKLDNWLEGFLFNSISKAWSQLEKGGYMAINIADVYCHHTVNKICDPMNDFISTLSGAQYQGAIGYRMAKRPNSGSAKTGVYVEPIWIWKKH